MGSIGHTLWRKLKMYHQVLGILLELAELGVKKILNKHVVKIDATINLTVIIFAVLKMSI